MASCSGDAQRPVQVRKALVHAASQLSTRDRRVMTREVHSIDMRPLIIHLLEGLQLAGIEHAVISLGDNSTQIMDAVTAVKLQIQVEYVFVPPTVWRTLANSINSARHAFAGDEAPFLVIRADQVYDWRLLHRVASVAFSESVDAYALVDTEASTLHWARGAHCTATCKDSGKCNALVKVHRDVASGRILQLAHQLDTYDAVNAGDVYITRPAIFDILVHELARGNLYCSTAEAMSHLARRGTLGYLEVGAFNKHWFGSKTVTAVFKAEEARQGGRMTRQEGAPGSGWQHILKAARDLMMRHSDVAASSGVYALAPATDASEHCQPAEEDDEAPGSSVDSAVPATPLRAPSGDHGQRRARSPWPTGQMLLPLLKIGEKLGEGANCQVVAATVGHSDVSPAIGWTSTAPGDTPWKNGLPTVEYANMAHHRMERERALALPAHRLLRTRLVLLRCCAAVLLSRG